MSNDKFFKNRHPEIKFGIQTISEERTKIKFWDLGEQLSISPLKLEYKEIWEEEGNQIILIELFHQSLDHNELLEEFSNKMSRNQQYRAQQKSMKYQIDPNIVIQQEEFNKYNPYNPESSFYKTISTLKGYGLIKKVAQTIATKNTYYSLTNIGKKEVVSQIALKFMQENVVFLSLLNHYQSKSESFTIPNQYPIESFSIPSMYILMRWIEQSSEYIDQLIVCFTSSLKISTLYNIYQDYLITMERENIQQIKKNSKKIQSELFQKLQSLSSIGLIKSDPKSGIYDLTQNGMNEFGNIYNKFQSIISNIEDAKLIKIEYNSQSNENIVQSSIALTNNGKIIAQKIKEEISNDEYLIMNLMNDIDYHDEYLLPIDDEMKRLKKIQYEAKKIDLKIPRRVKKGLKYQIMNIITHQIILSFLLVFGIIIMVFSIMNNFQNPHLIGVGVITFIISPILMIIRDRWRSLDQQTEYDFQLKLKLL